MEEDSKVRGLGLIMQHCGRVFPSEYKPWRGAHVTIQCCPFFLTHRGKAAWGFWRRTVFVRAAGELTAAKSVSHYYPFRLTNAESLQPENEEVTEHSKERLAKS